MMITDKQRQAIADLNLGGHPANEPYIRFDRLPEDGILIDGVLTISELRALADILDPPSPIDNPKPKL